MELITTNVKLDDGRTVTAISDNRGILTVLRHEDQLLRLHVSFLNEHADIEADELHTDTQTVLLNNPQVLARIVGYSTIKGLIYGLQGCEDYSSARNAAVRRRTIAELEEALITCDLPCDLTSILATTQIVMHEVTNRNDTAEFTFISEADGSLIMIVRSTSDYELPQQQNALHITDPEIVAAITEDIFVWREADSLQISELLQCSEETSIVGVSTQVGIVYETLVHMDNYWAKTTQRRGNPLTLGDCVRGLAR